MRTVTFQSVLNGVAERLGMSPSRDLTAVTATRLTAYITERCSEGWKFEFWPEWTVTQRRYLREAYDAARNVAAGDQRYFIAAGACYQALQAQTPAAQAPATLTGGTWVENSAYWALCAASYTGASGTGLNDWVTATVYAVGDKVRRAEDGEAYQCIAAHTSGGSFDAGSFAVLTAFDPYIAYEQVQGALPLTPMDEVKVVNERNPRVFPANAGRIDFEPSDNGIQLAAGAPQMVWVTFRLRPPVFTVTAYAAATTYGIGDLVYYSTSGECYQAIAAGTGHAPTNTTYWTKVDFPAVLGSWTKRAVFADGLKDQKQTDRAVEELREAYVELQDASDRALAQQGQWERAGVQTYGS